MRIRIGINDPDQIVKIYKGMRKSEKYLSIGYCFFEFDRIPDMFFVLTEIRFSILPLSGRIMEL